jgi:hypothetical protein
MLSKLTQTQSKKAGDSKNAKNNHPTFYGKNGEFLFLSR